MYLNPFVLWGLSVEWGATQLIVAVLAILAAKRQRLPGMWVLAVAAALSCLRNFSVALLTRCADLSKWPAALGSRNLLNLYPSVLIFLITLAGWAMLAFQKRRSDDA